MISSVRAFDFPNASMQLSSSCSIPGTGEDGRDGDGDGDSDGDEMRKCRARLGEGVAREAGSASRLDPRRGVEGVARVGIDLSCWVISVVTNGAITVNIAATGSMVGATAVALVVVVGPARPRVFTSGDGVTLQWARSPSEGGSLTPPRPAFCGEQVNRIFNSIGEGFAHNFTCPARQFELCEGNVLTTGRHITWTIGCAIPLCLQVINDTGKYLSVL